MTHSAITLARAVSANFLNFRGAVTVEKMVSRPWASIAFSGTRHAFTLRLHGPSAREAAAAFLTGLQDREFDLHGHILADLAAMDDLPPLGEDCVCLSFEALTVEDAC